MKIYKIMLIGLCMLASWRVANSEIAYGESQMLVLGPCTGIEQKDVCRAGNAFNLSASPNPFNPAVTIFVHNITTGHVKSGLVVAIYTSTGVCIRSWSADMDAGKMVQVTWDGTDASGRPAASGLYIVTVHWGNSQKTIKVVLAR